MQRCWSKFDNDTRLAISLDVAGLAASLTGIRAATTIVEAAAASVGATSALLGLTLFNSGGGGREYGIAGAGAAFTAHDIAKAAGRTLPSKLAASIPVIGLAVSGYVLYSDAQKAISDAKC